jgi:hypothetical protein
MIASDDHGISLSTQAQYLHVDTNAALPGRTFKNSFIPQGNPSPDALSEFAKRSHTMLTRFPRIFSYSHGFLLILPFG